MIYSRRWRLGRMLRWMTALTDDELQPRPLPPGWYLPVDPERFLATLRQTPSFGSTDAERVAAFMALPAAEQMPDGLRDDLRRMELL